MPESTEAETRIVLPNADFDALAATLDEPAEPVPALVDLFRRHRVTPTRAAEEDAMS